VPTRCAAAGGGKMKMKIWLGVDGAIVIRSSAVHMDFYLGARGRTRSPYSLPLLILVYRHNHMPSGLQYLVALLSTFLLSDHVIALLYSAFTET